MGSLYRPGDRLWAIEPGDFDGDGHADVCWMRNYANPQQPEGELRDFQVLINRGDGWVARIESLELGDRAIGGLDTGDLTGDGLPDFIAVDGYDYPRNLSQVRVFANSGNGQFELTQTIPLSVNHATDVVLGDFDDDGDVDAVVLAADCELDDYEGWKIYGSTMQVFVNNGIGELSPGTIIDLPYGLGSDRDSFPVQVQLGDLDGDGDLDGAILAVNYHESKPVEILFVENLNRGVEFGIRSGPQFGLARHTGSFIMADLDTDGLLDMVVRASSNPDHLLHSQGGFEFVVEELDLDYTSSPPTLADVDGDGQIDLAIGRYNGLSLYHNITPYSGPVLEHSSFRRGQPATMEVSNAQPGETVAFLYTVRGAGNSLGIRQLGGITLDLNDPIQTLGTARADSNGVAQFHFTVPPRAPLTEVVLQAVIRRGPGGTDSVKTPFRTTRIVP